MPFLHLDRARLPIDVTPALRGRIKVEAFRRGVTAAEMLCELLGLPHGPDALSAPRSSPSPYRRDPCAAWAHQGGGVPARRHGRRNAVRAVGSTSRARCPFCTSIEPVSLST